MGRTNIQWADMVWNPMTGCTPVSDWCLNCYARRMANRLRGRFGYPADEPFRVTLHPERLEEPSHWRKARRVFVVSMGDLFHPDVPADFITDVYDVMKTCRRHTFIVLTKRPERLAPVLYGREGGFYLGGGDYISNVWHLVSVENQEQADKRIPELLRFASQGCGAWPVLGVCCEPLLGPVDLSRWLWRSGAYGAGETVVSKYDPSINWVIAGGETGPRARPMWPEWVRSIRDQCQTAGVPFYFKHWGESAWYDSPPPNKRKWRNFFEQVATPNDAGMYYVGRRAAGRLLDGRLWEEYPYTLPQGEVTP